MSICVCYWWSIRNPWQMFHESTPLSLFLFLNRNTNTYSHTHPHTHPHTQRPHTHTNTQRGQAHKHTPTQIRSLFAQTAGSKIQYSFFLMLQNSVPSTLVDEDASTRTNCFYKNQVYKNHRSSNSKKLRIFEKSRWGSIFGHPKNNFIENSKFFKMFTRVMSFFLSMTLFRYKLMWRKTFLKYITKLLNEYLRSTKNVLTLKRRFFKESWGSRKIWFLWKNVCTLVRQSLWV